MIGCFNGADCVCPLGIPPTPAIEGGMQVFPSQDGARGMIVVEARNGANGNNVGTTLHVGDPFTQRPDLQIEADRDMGDGSTEIFCVTGDASFAGGIAGIPTPGFGPGGEITEALNDHACRFSAPRFSGSQACTKNVNGNPGFLGLGTRVQFCHGVWAAESFAGGDTVLTVRMLDNQGTPGPTVQIKVRAPTATATAATATPTASPTTPPPSSTPSQAPPSPSPSASATVAQPSATPSPSASSTPSQTPSPTTTATPTA